MTREYWHERRLKKDGTPGKRFEIVVGPEYTQLRTCEHCGRFGIPRRVSYRNDCYVCDWHEFYEQGTPMLCTGCWSRMRRVVNELRLLRECKRLVRQLEIAVRDVRRQERMAA